MEEFDQAPASGDIGRGRRAWAGREGREKLGPLRDQSPGTGPLDFDWRRVRSQMGTGNFFPGAAGPVWNLWA